MLSSRKMEGLKFEGGEKGAGVGVFSGNGASEDFLFWKIITLPTRKTTKITVPIPTIQTIFLNRICF